MYDEAAVRNELTRAFGTCHGCRRCVDLCSVFPSLFELLARFEGRTEYDSLNTLLQQDLPGESEAHAQEFRDALARLTQATRQARFDQLQQRIAEAGSFSVLDAGEKDEWRQLARELAP